MQAARKLGVCGAIVSIVIASALPALADPPPGHGNGNATHVAPGQAKQGSAPAPAATHTAPPVPAATPTRVPPGQVKKAGRGAPATHGKAHRNGQSKGHGYQNRNVTKGAAGAGHNPPGNNGTVKIHSVAGDLSHHNVAHPGCSFFVDFWGFDQGQTLDVSFVGQSPTGNGSAVSFVAPRGTSITSPDPAGGGNDFDGELPFIATPDALAALGAPAKQGYHVRLLVATHQGGGMKQKVFWIGPCASAGQTSSLTTSRAAAAQVSRPVTPALASGGSTRVGGTSRQVRHASTQDASPRIVQASSALSSLPFTGADIGGMVVVGLAAIGAGVALTTAGRRRQVRQPAP